MSLALAPTPESTATILKVTTPEQLVECWPFVRAGLLKIKERQHGHSYWMPEHVFESIATAKADLFLVQRDEATVGFFVLTLMRDPFVNANMCMFVWFAWSMDGGVDESDAFIEDYARAKGCVYLECLTQRDGLLRRMGRNGWYGAYHILRKELY